MVDKGMTMQGLGMITVGILALVVIYTIIPVVGSQLDIAVTIPTNAFATGTYTFSGNVSNGELVNITNGAAVYRFEFNTTGNGADTTVVLTANAIRVNASSIGSWNSSVKASGNLTAAINANASAAAIVTAANTTSKTTLTAVTIGDGSNSITLADNAVNIASTGMAGGTDGSQWDSVTNPSIPTAVDFWETLGTIVKVGGVIVVVGGFLQTLRGLRG
jgi:hypothetical protein